MTLNEWALCMACVVCSSVSQLFLKSCSASGTPYRRLLFLGVAGALQLGAALIAVLVLRTLQLSQLIPFAAAGYFLVPLGGRLVFRERLLPGFWWGAALIVIGILCANA